MGWKSVKDHYRIGHTVSVYEDKGICIGSSLCHDLVVIDPWRRKVGTSSLGVRGNEELQRYWTEINADLDKLWELVDADDAFSASIPVYTWKGADIIEEFCETPGHPNITHDGHLMYENRFSTDRDQALQWAIEEAEAGISLGIRRLDELGRDVAKSRKLLEEDRNDLAKLRHEQIMSRLGGTHKKEESE